MQPEDVPPSVPPTDLAENVPLRVLFVLDSLSSDAGGPARSVPGLAEALLARGVVITVLAGPSPTPVALSPSVAAHTHFLDRPVGMLRRGLRSLRAAYVRWRDEAKGAGPALVHLQHIWSPLVHHIACWARRDRIPYVVSPRGMLSPWALGQKRCKKGLALALYQRRDLNRARAIHVTAPLEAEEIKPLRLRAPLVVVPNGLEVPVDLPAPRETAQPERTVLFLSRLHPKKGLADLLTAWQRVRPEGWRLLIAGPDEIGERGAHERYVAEQGLSESVRFLGPVDDATKWELLARADLFVLPTRSENFGIVVAEALAAGTPVITTQAAPWPAIAERGLGWWIPVALEPLTEALAEALARSESERREMGERGRAYIREHFGYATIAEQMHQLYSRAVAEPSNVAPDPDRGASHG